MKLDGGLSLAKLDAWWQSALPQDRQSVADVLFSIIEGTWVEDWHHWDDVTRANQYIVEVHSDLIMVVRFFDEYPDTFVLVYIGHPDG
ncbi:MAG: hypothetical protein QOC82_412 [Frankiaceae bacterium]|nr:hypothetical protein [Frankiaceae bacterium]